ncbi:hypothetical protein [Ottowia oryzae]|nr:hypothetical protein [Ottowia oryzae]
MNAAQGRVFLCPAALGVAAEAPGLRDRIGLQPYSRLRGKLLI